jgi:hypothetical protein
MAADIVPRLRNLGALIFEILPEHLPALGLDGVQRQIEDLKKLWKLRPNCPTGPAVTLERAEPTPLSSRDVLEVSQRESALVAAIRASAMASANAGAPSSPSDPGYALLAFLIGDGRRASLARSLRYSILALLLGLGEGRTRALLDSYCAQCSPEPFAAVEADAFARFLRGQPSALRDVPWLDEVLAFEHALVRATLYGASSDVVWSTDPSALFEALDAGRLPSPGLVQRVAMRVQAG